MKNDVKNMIQFFISFLSILDPFWAPSWGHVGAMLATNPQKSDLENNTKKTPKTEGPGKSGNEILGALNNTETTPQPTYKGRKHALTASAVADICTFPKRIV